MSVLKYHRRQTRGLLAIVFTASLSISACSSSGNDPAEPATVQENASDSIVMDDSENSDVVNENADTSTDNTDSTSETTDTSTENTDTSNDTSTENTDTSSETTDTSNEAGQGFVVEVDGIRTELLTPAPLNVEYEFIEYRDNPVAPYLLVKVTNNSDDIIDFGSCTTEAFKDGVLVDEGITVFADFGILKPGDTTSERADFLDLDTLDELDSVELDCVFYETLPVRQDPNVVFEFIEYTSDEFGSSAFRAQVTNNSGETIKSASCLLTIRNGNTVIRTVFMSFNELDPILPGESYVAQSRIGADFNDFDSGPIIEDEFICSASF